MVLFLTLLVSIPLTKSISFEKTKISILSNQKHVYQQKKKQNTSTPIVDTQLMTLKVFPCA